MRGEYVFSFSKKCFIYQMQFASNHFVMTRIQQKERCVVYGGNVVIVSYKYK